MHPSCICVCIHTYIHICIHTHLHEGVSCIQDSVQFHYVVKSDLDFWASCLFFLSDGVKTVLHWLSVVPRGEPRACLLHWLYVVLRGEPRVCLLSKKPTSRALPMVLHTFYLFLQEKLVRSQHRLLFKGMLGHYLQQHSRNHRCSAGSSENAKDRIEYRFLLS